MDYASQQSAFDESALQASTLTSSGAEEDRSTTCAVAVIAIVIGCLLFAVALTLSVLGGIGPDFDDEDVDGGGGGGSVDRLPPVYPSSVFRAETQVPKAPTLTSQPPVLSAATASAPTTLVAPAPSTTLVSPSASSAAPTTQTPSITQVSPSAPSAAPSTQASPTPLTAPAATTTSAAPTTPPPPAGPKPSDQALLCTFGRRTAYNTKFPTDGLCDFTFYDSMYKRGVNTLTRAGFTTDMEAVLREAYGGGRARKTKYGVGFAYSERNKVRTDLANAISSSSTPLEVLFIHNVLHLGIIDAQIQGNNPSEMDVVFECFQLLNTMLEPKRNQGQESFIVLGATSHTNALNSYLKDKFRTAFMPDLFISHGHQMNEDWDRRPCIVTPPTLLERRSGLNVIVNLPDAAASLATIHAEANSPRLAISVTMMGRWAELLPGNPAEIFSRCSQNSVSGHRDYTTLCNSPPYSANLVYDPVRHAMRTHDPGNRRIFVYDNEQALCTKLCKVKANYTGVNFGVAVFDLDYDDSDNVCQTINRFSNYSRFKTVNKVVNFFASHYTSPSKEAECSQLWN